MGDRGDRRVKKKKKQDHSFYCYLKICVRFGTTMQNGSSTVIGPVLSLGKMTLQCVLLMLRLKLIFVYTQSFSLSSKSKSTKQGSQDLIPQSPLWANIFWFLRQSSHFLFQLLTWWFLLYSVSFPRQQNWIKSVTIKEVQQALVLRKECGRVFIIAS